MDMLNVRTMRYSDIQLFVMREILIRTALETRAKVGLIAPTWSADKHSTDVEVN